VTTIVLVIGRQPFKSDGDDVLPRKEGGKKKQGSETDSSKKKRKRSPVWSTIPPIIGVLGSRLSFREKKKERGTPDRLPKGGRKRKDNRSYMSSIPEKKIGTP